MTDHIALIDKLNEEKNLSHNEWVSLFEGYTREDREYAASIANALREKKFGNKVYIRGIVEFSNYCRNDCYYCGICRSNKNAERYRLAEEDIMECCKEGYAAGYRTFVLQSGEDPAYSPDRVAALVKEIKRLYPDCAVTLSIGELDREDYALLREAGADRYLLRHETAVKEHYEKLHPSFMSFEHRMKCLRDLKELGFQTGAGMMIGSPFQTAHELAEDMIFLADFKPHMVGTGPFLPHKDTIFRDKPKGSYELTLFILALVRIMLPNVLLPATTALGTIHPQGREQGILHGANVIMPNLSPLSVRKKYMLYDDKIGTSDSSEDIFSDIKARLGRIGCEAIVSRGDHSE